jgi:hypothetical protein
MTPVQSIRRRRRPLARLAAGSALAGLTAVLALAGGTSAATDAARATPGNTAPPQIVGDIRQGSGIAASTGAWSNAPTSFAYQWYRCSSSCSPLSGANHETYVVTSGDAGKKLKVVVTATNSGGSAAQDSAEASVGSLPSGAPADQSPPSVSGTAKRSQTLTATSGSWSGGTIGYRWLRCDTTGGNCGSIGATGSTYTLVSADVGATLRVKVTAANGSASSSAVSSRTGVVSAGSAPVNTSLPSISGVLSDNAKLTADKGGWKGDAPITYSYQWRRCNSSGSGCSNVGGNSATYNEVSADVGHTMAVIVTAKNAAGQASATSPHTGVVARPQKPANVSKPTVSGNVSENSVLHARPGNWSGTQPITLAYQWRRCDSHGNRCGEIRGATAADYRLTVADVGHRLQVYVTAKNYFGSTRAYSKSTSVVGGATPLNTSVPTISGGLAQGATLTANPGSWSSASKLGYHYQWFRCDSKGAHCTGIVGASRQTYVLTNADVGHTVLVQVRAQNSQGSTIANSKPSGVVGGAASGGVAVSGIALPDRLEVDRVSFSPRQITTRRRPLVVRVHVREIDNGKPVAGALVRVIAIPYNRLTATREVATDGSGWATLTFTVRNTFPLRRGYLITMFVRARKPGGNLLAGISTRRLVSVHVG